MSKYAPKRANDNSNIPVSQKKSSSVNPKKNRLLIGLIAFCSIALIALVSLFVVLMMMTANVEPVLPVASPLPPSPSPRPSPMPSPSPEPTPDPMEGMVFSPLTGLPIPEEGEFLRPVAVVINNHSRALPQSGISEAEIIYEVLAEGNITRLVAIFHQLEADRIGPVRSTREYFTDFALDNDAVLIHHGGSPSGYARIRSLGVPNLDGMVLEGTTFWRDPERRRIPALIEHSSYTGAAEIEEALYRRGIRRERYEDDGIGFEFNLYELSFDALARATGGEFRPCLELTVPFSSAYARRFVYDPEYSKYAVYNAHGPHIDENTDEQLMVANILVQNVRSRVVPGDEEGRREVTTVGSGTGYLATAGGIVTVRWERDSHQSPTRWYFINGSPVLLTPGQIWICVLQDTAEIQVITGLEEDTDEEEE